ncbi:hypothetical protein KJ359_002097 [Pestalotiopsis sp. 9143b]|nr:hypothetical protein KJ359_002097 [Pestalotiopsis sp. 9143b]
MMVLADFDLLEKAVGRNGRCLTQAEEAALEKWTSSEDTYDDADRGTTSGSSHQDADGAPELGLAGLHATVIDGSLLKMTMFALADMLRTLGHWGLARRFADILTILATKQ